MDNRLSKNQYKVLIALLSFRAKNTEVVWPSREMLSTRCGLPVTRISTITTQLCALGWLQKDGKGGFSKSTRYTVTVPTTITEPVTVTDSVTVTETVTRGVTETVTPMPVTKTVTRKELTNNRPLEQTNKGKSRFTPPSLEDVTRYCAERKNKINPRDFIDYYSATNWHRGKTKISDWKACVRTWESRDKQDSPKEHVRTC